MYDSSVDYAVKKWGQIIERYFICKFSDYWLPSHDLEHHKRVWQYAGLLSQSLNAPINFRDIYFNEKLIMACFFHDLGMIVDRREKHGTFSRKLCEEFLKEYVQLIEFDVEELLEAISNHDNKNYYHNPYHTLGGIYKILTLADDMDAFGAIGSYRYVEIYLLRGYDEQEIPGRILANARKRFENMQLAMQGNDFSLTTIRHNFNILKKLFNPHSFEDIATYLVQWINQNIVIPKGDPYSLISNFNPKYIVDSRVLYFCKQFKEQLK